jgi:hypothetical protein
MLSSGSRDRNILQRDVRAPDDYVSKLIGHKSEVRRSSSFDWGALSQVLDQFVFVPGVLSQIACAQWC